MCERRQPSLGGEQGEGRRQAKVEGTGAPMQRAVDVPGLDPLPLAKLACGREAALLALKAHGMRNEMKQVGKKSNA